jgi:predicted phosphodiesterase
MPKAKQKQGEIVIKAIKDFPKTSKRALAEMLADNYPALFTFDSARSLIKVYTKDESITGERAVIFSGQNPFGLNYSKAKKIKYVSIPNVFNNILWLSDIHFPNHCIPSLTAALQYGLDNNINCIVLGGDILDNEPFTNHDAPPPSKNDVLDWFEMVEEFLDMLKEKFPTAKLYWLEGNHDNWYVRYLMKKAPVLFGDEYYRLPQRLNLKERNVEFLEQNIILKAGKLHLLHGHTIIRGFMPPAQPSRNLLNRTLASTLIGHVHQNTYTPTRTLDGSIIGCWTVGCLCTLSPDYDPHNIRHSNGFAHIKFQQSGEFNVQLKEIYKGKVL